MLREYKWNEYVTIEVESQIKQLRSSPKKVFRGFNGIRTRGLCVQAALLHQLSYEDRTLEAGQFIEFINPLKEWNTEWSDVNCGNTNEMNMRPSQLNRNLSDCEEARKKVFRSFSAGRALQRDRRGYGFESRWSPEKLFFGLVCNCLNCDSTAMVTYSFHLYYVRDP